MEPPGPDDANGLVVRVAAWLGAAVLVVNFLPVRMWLPPERAVISGLTQTVYVLNHPDYIRDLLVTHHARFKKGRALQRAKRLLGEGLLTSEGEFWRRQRRLAQPAFHRQRINSYAETMVAYAEKTSARWRGGEALDVSAEMMRLTLAVVGKTLFDADVESDADEVGAALAEVMSLFGYLMLPFSEVASRG